MKKITVLLLMATFALLVGCSNPKSQILPTDPNNMDELAPVMQKLSEEDRQLLVGYLMRAGVSSVFGGEGIPPGTAIGEALEQQKAFIAEQQRKEEEERLIREKIKAERAAKQKEFDDTVAVAFVEKKLILSDIYRGRYSDQIKVVFGFKNKTEKEISGIKGTCKFFDMFGDEIKSINLSYDEGVPAGKTKQWSGYIDVNEFIDEDMKLASTKDEKIKFVFEPEMIIFKDGSKLKMPEQI